MRSEVHAVEVILALIIIAALTAAIMSGVTSLAQPAEAPPTVTPIDGAIVPIHRVIGRAYIGTVTLFETEANCVFAIDGSIAVVAKVEGKC